MMAWVDPGAANTMTVEVSTTSDGGHPPEFWAHRCVERLMQVSETAPAPIREQALAFRDKMEHVVLVYMKRAIQSDRTTVVHALKEAGHPELTEPVRRL